MPSLSSCRSPDLPVYSLPLPDGRWCLVRVAQPSGPTPPGGWPTAWVLDHPQFLQMCGDPAGMPGLLVGLAPEDPADRVWDYTPRWPARASPPPGVAGHAGAWLRVLQQARLRVAHDFCLDSGSQVFIGHSLGALFGLYALLHWRLAFDGYVLSSPSVWWGGGYMARLWSRRQAWLPRQGLPALGISLSVGEHEQGLGPDDASADPDERARRLGRRQTRAMVDGMWALADEFGRCPGLRLRAAVLPGRGHQTAPQDALVPGWRWLLDARP